MNRRIPARRDEVHSITTAHEAHSTALGAREKRYAISMGIRTACFIGAVVADGWLRWVLLVGAAFLPYVAVVLANSGVRRRPGGGDDFTPMEYREIEGERRNEL